jgi:hypothetical protein
MPKGQYTRGKTQSLSVRLQELTEEVRQLEGFRTTIDAYLAGSSSAPKAPRRKRRTKAEMLEAAANAATPVKRSRKPARRKKAATTARKPRKKATPKATE